MSNLEIILASASPRRKEILENQGISFTVRQSEREEKTKETIPAKAVRDLAEQKAFDVYDQLPEKQNVLIIAADTVVAKDGVILGKPVDEEDAVRMLKLLQGDVHKVYTGVTLLLCEEETTAIRFQEETEVVMYPMSEDEILRYAAAKEPMDKAGAYAIQGNAAVFIKEIRGDYNNVVGLPIARIYQELRKRGIRLV